MAYHLHAYFNGNQLWNPLESFDADELGQATATGQEYANALNEPVALYEYKFFSDPELAESTGIFKEDIYPENY